MNINNIHIIVHILDKCKHWGCKINKTISNLQKFTDWRNNNMITKKYHSVVQCNGVFNIILTHKIMKSGTQLCLKPRSTMYHVYDFVPQFLCLYNGDDDNTL